MVEVLGSFSSHKTWRTGYGILASIKHGEIVMEFQYPQIMAAG
jgi:hypothetical protein